MNSLPHFPLPKTNNRSSRTRKGVLQSHADTRPAAIRVVGHVPPRHPLSWQRHPRQDSQQARTSKKRASKELFLEEHLLADSSLLQDNRLSKSNCILTERLAAGVLCSWQPVCFPSFSAALVVHVHAPGIRLILMLCLPQLRASSDRI